MRGRVDDDGERNSRMRYGRFYWCAKVTKELCPKGEIYVMADRVKESAAGALWFIKDNDKEDEGEPWHANLIIAAGQWTAVFAASCMDGSAVAVEHWKGEVERG